MFWTYSMFKSRELSNRLRTYKFHPYIMYILNTYSIYQLRGNCKLMIFSLIYIWICTPYSTYVFAIHLQSTHVWFPNGHRLYFLIYFSQKKMPLLKKNIWIFNTQQTILGYPCQNDGKLICIFLLLTTLDSCIINYVRKKGLLGSNAWVKHLSLPMAISITQHDYLGSIW